MAYVSLYRKYRPQTFEDVVGQDHVTRTLINAIDEDRLHHAYLFTGPRGTGKTSTARILAKALNCVEGPTSTPCNECAQCVAITAGNSVDVIELDMASHGGVDDARELRDRALFAPATGRRKVYILDEVHMASTAAFNALLKLVEEPPGHVVFAMATTDPQKVLPTIMSRVQRLDLRRVSAPDVASHVRRVCAEEGYEIEDGAVDAVVRAGDGSVRDTLSVLEQVLSYSGTEVTAAKVAETLGHTPVERTFDAVDLVAARDLAGLLAMVQGLLDDGHDLRRFTFDLLQHLRDLLVLQVAPDHPDLVDATDEQRARLLDQREALPRDTILRAVSLLADTVTEQRQGPTRLPLELALAKLAVPAAGGDIGDLADRVARLEAGAAAAPRRPAAPRPARTAEPVPAEPAAAEPGTEPATSDAEPAPADQPPAEGDDAAAHTEDPAPEAANPIDRGGLPDGPVAEVPAPDPDTPSRGHGQDDLDTIRSRWEAILEMVKDDKRRFHAVFEPAQPVRLRKGVLTLGYPPRYRSFHAENAKKGEYAASLQRAIERSCGLRVRVDVRIDGEGRSAPQPPVVTADERDESAPDPAEQAAVREAEESGPPAADPDDTGRLLVEELGAELVEEHAPDDGD